MVVLRGRCLGRSDGSTGVYEFDYYGHRGCIGWLRCVREDRCGPVYCWLSGFRCFVLSLLYYGDMDIEEVGGMTDHGPVYIVVLLLVFGK